MPRKKIETLTDEKLIDLFKIPEVPNRSWTTMRDFHQKSYKRGKYWAKVKSKIYKRSNRS